jgi:hypothetical protein
VALTRFCSNPSCRRGFVSLLKGKPELPMLCPTCRRDMAPLSRLVGGRERKAEAHPEPKLTPPPPLEETAR